MELTNKISRQLLLWIVVWFLILGLVLALSGYWGWQILAGSLMVVGFFLWLTQRISLMRVIRKDEAKPQEKREAAADDQCRALHLLSLLQREGRLVDFLREDLQAYDDAQIGAAVRSIHENCQKTLNKYLAPEAVIDQNEGDEVTVDPGFDASAVKLTGNVSGEPPFKGVLQHRGWRATAFDLPTLSGSQDPDIIAPAEVEIE